jgi:hypothetical protein
VRPDPFARPLDATLERLRAHGITYRCHIDHLDRWVTFCPICGDSLTLREPYVGAAVAVRCDGGCHESRIVGALAAEPSPHDEGLDLAEAVADIARRAIELLEDRCQ